MPTISFSVEDSVKREIAKIARRTKKSKSEVFRDMVKVYNFTNELDAITARTASVLESLAITTEDELYDYLDSDQTYADRIRH